MSLHATNGYSNFMLPPGVSAPSSSHHHNDKQLMENNPVYLPFAAFFNQRPLPKPLFQSAVVTENANKRRLEAELFRNQNYKLAAGFNMKLLDQRNWIEMISCFPDINVSGVN